MNGVRSVHKRSLCVRFDLQLISSVRTKKERLIIVSYFHYELSLPDLGENTAQFICQGVEREFTAHLQTFLL
jgi:hypothetical protein